MTNKELAQAILALTGPAENIVNAYSCMTRLRLTVKAETFTKEELEKLPEVIGINKSGDEWQIFLGPGKATNVTTEFKALLAAQPPAPAAEKEDAAPQKDKTVLPKGAIGDGRALHEEIRKKNATPGKLALKKISRIFIPIIPAFIACGLIMGILNVAFKVNPELASWPFMKMLAIAGNAAFWGMNIFVGINTAKEFGGSPMLGGVMAAVISHPGLANITLNGEALLPGRGGIIAVLLVAAFAAFLEKKFHKIVPEMLDLFLTPLLVVIISTFVALLICQPVGGWLADVIGYAATTSIGKGGAITGFIMGGCWLPMVMLGIHQGLTPIHASLLSQYGVTILLPILAMAGGGQVGAAVAVYCKTKNKFLRRTVASALPVGIMGIGEPLIYGVTLPLGKPFIGACIGGAFGGAVQATFMVGAATMGISGLPLAAGTDNIPIYLVGLAVSYICGFIATWLIGFDDPPENPDEA